MCLFELCFSLGICPVVDMHVSMHVCAKSLQSCPILCDPMDCSPPVSSVFGISQAIILELCTSPGNLSNSGIKPACLLASRALRTNFYYIKPPCLWSFPTSAITNYYYIWSSFLLKLSFPVSSVSNASTVCFAEPFLPAPEFLCLRFYSPLLLRRAKSELWAEPWMEAALRHELTCLLVSDRAGQVGTHSTSRSERTPCPWPYQEQKYQKTSLVVQWIRLFIPNAVGPGSIPSRGTKIPHATTRPTH